MKSIETKVFPRIYARGKGYVFSSSDFIDLFSINNIDKALSNLVKKNKIRRIARGIYDYPKYSELLKKKSDQKHSKISIIKKLIKKQ